MTTYVRPNPHLTQFLTSALEIILNVDASMTTGWGALYPICNPIENHALGNLKVRFGALLN